MRTSFIRLTIASSLLIGAALNAEAKTGKGDSLRVLLSTAPHDTARVRMYKLISSDWLYNHGEMDSTMANAHRGAALYDKLPKEQQLALRPLRMKLFEYEGFALHQRGENPEALERLQAGARLAQELKLSLDESGFYMYMAQVFRVMEDGANLLKYCRMALAIQEPLGPSSDLALTHYNISGYYVQEERWDSAEFYAKKALAFFRGDDDAMRQLASETLLLQIYHRTRQLDSAEVHLKAAEAIAMRVNYPPAFTLLHGMRGRIALFRGRYAEALADIDTSLALSERLGIPMDKVEAYKLRGLALAANHRLDEAFMALDSSQATVLRDMGLDKQRELTETRMTFEQEKGKAVAEAEIKRQRTTKWAAVGVAILVAVIAFALWRLFRLKARTARELQAKNEEIQRTSAQLLIVEKQREAEQVRTRIARDIHDEIGASLTKIRLLSDVAATNSAEQLEDTQRALTRIGEHVRRVSQSMSDIVWAVDPARDTHQGMLDHVRELSRRLLGDNGIEFSLDLACTLPTSTLEPHLRRDLHLLINEAFNNILKYAKAHHVHVHLLLNTYRFTLRVADDGVGFELGTVQGTGNGLRNMRDRIARYQGTLHVHSAPGQGTRVEAEGRF